MIWREKRSLKTNRKLRQFRNVVVHSLKTRSEVSAKATARRLLLPNRKSRGEAIVTACFESEHTSWITGRRMLYAPDENFLWFSIFLIFLKSRLDMDHRIQLGKLSHVFSERNKNKLGKKNPHRSNFLPLNESSSKWKIKMPFPVKLDIYLLSLFARCFLV